MYACRREIPKFEFLGLNNLCVGIAMAYMCSNSIFDIVQKGCQKTEKGWFLHRNRTQRTEIFSLCGK